jgi:nucleolar GTP-binding protein
MTTPFERIPPVEDPDDLVDRAFSASSGAAESASGADSQRAQIGSAASAVSGAFGDLVEGFPSFDRLEGFDAAIADVAVDVDAVRQALGSVDWAADQVESVAADAQAEIADADDTDDAIAARKRGLARIQSVVDEVRDDLATLREARDVLTRIPEVAEAVPTAVLVGAPNTGKSTVLDGLTAASPPIDDYPFTSQVLAMGHIEDDETHRRYQLLDTPGLLDRPMAERNEMERQAATAIDEVADLLVVLVDPTETCGYDREQQAALAAELLDSTDAPALVVATKRDLLDGAVGDESNGDPAAGLDDTTIDLAIDARDTDDIERLRRRIVAILRDVAVPASPADEA